MMRSIQVDYCLDVVCDHTRQGRSGIDADPRTVCRIVHRPAVPGAFGRLDWLEAVIDDDEERTDALQTYYGEARRLRRFELRKPDGSHLAPTELVPGMHDGQRWRFHCEDCGDTLPVNHQRVLPILEKLREAGLPSITLRGLGATLGV